MSGTIFHGFLFKSCIAAHLFCWCAFAPNDATAETPTTPNYAIPSSSELLERERVDRHVSRLLMLSKFAELEALATRYRDQKERSPSGLWYLRHFYGGVKHYLKSVHTVAVKDAPKGHWKDRSDKVHAEVIENWRQAYPNSPTPYLAHALRLRSQAWKIRGPGYANEVQDWAWAVFYKKMREARDYMEKHRALASKDPHWYSLRTHIALELGEPTTSIMETVTEGLDREPYYYPLYFAAVRHLLPKWSGQPQYIDAFANMAVERTSERDGMSLYARIYWYASQMQYGGLALFTSTGISWDKMTAGMNDILSKYPDNWNINNFLFFACVVGDREQAKNLIELMRGDALERVWGRTAYFDACKDFALGGKKGA